MTNADDEDNKAIAPLSGLVGVGLGLAVAVAIGVFPSCAPEQTLSKLEVSPQAQPVQQEDAMSVQIEGFGETSDDLLQDGRIVKRELVVKFHALDEADAINEQFWTNKVGAQNAFKQLRRTYPFLDGAVLLRATYSGELVLGLEPIANETPSAQKTRFKAFTHKLSKQPQVAYAEPNVIVRPGQADK